MSRFQQGDEVSYIGQKFAEELGGELGVIYAHVQGTDNGVVVDFGNKSYIMDEMKHLVPYNKALAKKEKKEDRKEVKVEQRYKKAPPPRDEED